MPWREVKVTNQRCKLIELWNDQKHTVSELCRIFEISRKTAYKWINRYLELGAEGLVDLSKAPLTHGRKICDVMEDDIIQVRVRFPTWGPKKIKAFLETKTNKTFPSASTIGNVLTRNGLVIPQKKRLKIGPRTQPLAHAVDANDVWCIDFKGWWMTGDNKKIEPFTVSDASTRYLLNCLPIPANNTNYTWGVLSKLFREYGLPNYIRSDNGPPFASRAAGGLSRLAVKLIKSKVLPERIRPGKPQENGRLERLHLTLKQDMSSHLCDTYINQLELLSSWQRIYNEERPHESIENRVPFEIYSRSKKSWYGQQVSPEYPDHWKVLKVQNGGSCSWKGKNTYIGRVLENEPIGVVSIDNDIDGIFYGPVPLGFMDHQGVLKRIDKRLLKKVGKNLDDELKCYLSKWAEV